MYRDGATGKERVGKIFEVNEERKKKRRREKK